MSGRDILRAAIVAGAVIGFADAASALSASFSWKGIPPRSGTSPAFSLSGVPKGTARLRFAMIDHDAPNYSHGGSTIAYAGKPTVPRGAINDIGPHPPGGQVHRYRWTVEALDAAGMVLGRTQAQGSFPP